MVQATSTPTLDYPTGVGQPVAESDVHFWTMTTIAQVLTQSLAIQPTPFGEDLAQWHRVHTSAQKEGFQSTNDPKEDGESQPCLKDGGKKF